MKTVFQKIFALAAMATLMQWSGVAFAQFHGAGETEQRSVLTISPDGSCRFTAETVESRSAAEQQLRMMERYKNMSEQADPGDDAAPPKPELSSTNEAKPFTDEELRTKLNDSMAERYNNFAEEAGQKFGVEVKKDTVVFTTSRTFPSIEEMLKDSYGIWREGSVAFENARFETDTNGLLRLTLTPQSGMERYLKTFRSEWKLSGVKSELKIIFPGKVVASGFPAMETNATWLAIDAKKDESLDAVAKIYTQPTVITAELGGLKLEQPLESKKLRRSARARNTGADDLPVTDAGPGFVAEAQSITTTMLHVFPGGETYFKEDGGYSRQQPGAVVNAKLFAPKGRTLKSVSEVRVLTAVDNQGRSVVKESESEENGASYSYSGGREDAAAMQVQLQLKLPEPDAQAIDQITAEAVAVTAGTWKEMTLTNLQQSATNELDLSAVLPGAKLVITKVTFKNSRLSLQARIKGPRTVQRLDCQAKIPGVDNFNSYGQERNFTTKGTESTRNLTIQGYGFSADGGEPQAAPILVVRYPEDLRQERVKFKLSGLDLL